MNSRAVPKAGTGRAWDHDMEDITIAPASTKNITRVDSEPPRDRQEEIAQIASHVFEVREGKEGTPVEDWLKAEAILVRKERAAEIEQPLVDHVNTKNGAVPR
jgi:hypothetical protein